MREANGRRPRRTGFPSDGLEPRLRNPDGETRHAVLARSRDVPAVRTGDLPRDRKAKPRPARRRRARIVASVEFLEYAVKVFGRYLATPVHNHDFEPIHRTDHALPHMNLYNASLVCVGKRVFQHVVEHA